MESGNLAYSKKNIIWLVSFDRLPHKILLNQRHIIQYDSCDLCVNIPENSHRVHRDFLRAKEVWGLYNVSGDFSMTPFILAKL